MASISSSNSLPPSWLSESNNTSLRDASFSSYLNSTEETYIHSLVGPSQNLAISNHQQHDYPFYNSRKKKVEDGEIDVFRADKYFNGGIDQETTTRSLKYQQQQLSKDHTERMSPSLSKFKPQPRTPSMHSDSSWNSQSALLKRVQRNPSKSNSQAKRSSFLSCSCCTNKKSVEVDAQEFNSHGNNRSIGNGSGHDRGVPRTIKTSFETAEITRLNKLRLDTEPFIVPVSDPLTGAKKIQVEDEDEEKKRKESLEVFGSNEMEDDEEGSKRFSLEKRLNMLSWDAIPRSVDEINTSGAPSETYKDTESDASSDLFEIECLSCTANPVLQGPRHSCDGHGTATPTTAYAPSEVSVDWSVVTASAANFSMVSDEDQKSTLTSVSRSRMAPKPTSIAKMATNKELPKAKTRTPGMLSGCKSQKAVRVAGDNHHRSPGKGKPDTQRMHRFSDSFTPMTRFNAEAKLPVFGLRPSKTITSSDLLYI